MEHFLLLIKAHIWETIASLISLISALFAWRSNTIAKRALTIARQELQNKKSNFTLYLIDGYRIRDRKGKPKKVLLFNITINNKSDLPNTFKATLKIEYLKEDGSVTRAIMEHNPSLSDSLKKNQLTIYPANIRVEEKSMTSQWLLFEQPTGVFDEYRIEKYSICILDSHLHEVSIEANLIKEIDDEHKED